MTKKLNQLKNFENSQYEEIYQFSVFAHFCYGRYNCKHALLPDLPSVPTSFGQESSIKISKFRNGEKNSLNFVYILVKQCRSHYNLTNYFDKKYQNYNFT